MNLKNHKPNLLSNTNGLYNGNYGERNSNLATQNTLSLNIGGGTFNHSTRAKENFLSKSVGLDGLHKSHNFGSMKSKSTSNRIGAMKKSGPIKATLVNDKARASKYEHLSSKYSGVSTSKIQHKHHRRDKRPRSSTFIGNHKQDMAMYSKLMSSQAKAKCKSTTKTNKEGVKKKNNKRVRSASPAGLKNIISQKQPNKPKQTKRVIGGHLYQHSMNGIAGFN